MRVGIQEVLDVKAVDRPPTLETVFAADRLDPSEVAETYLADTRLLPPIIEHSEHTAVVVLAQNRAGQ